MSQIGTELPTEYSDRFDKLRQNRVEVSFINLEIDVETLVILHLQKLAKYSLLA